MPGFVDAPGFADAVRSVLSDLLNLPPQFMDYTVQYAALNPLPIPVSQLTGYSSQVPQSATPIETTETTTSDSYVDLSTAGPQLTNLPDGHYTVVYGACASTDTASVGAIMSIDVNGVGAADADSTETQSLAFTSIMRAVPKLVDGGNNSTITCKYRTGTSGKTASFGLRWMYAVKYANL